MASKLSYLDILIELSQFNSIFTPMVVLMAMSLTSAVACKTHC